MNISRRTSSGSSSGCCGASPVIAESRSDRRMWSIARRLAVVVSHAAGLSGTPAAGHCSSAATSASCASSSASPTSWTSRRSPATIRADSCFQTTPTVAATSISGLRAEDLLDRALAVADDPAEPAAQLDRLLLAADLDQREAGDRLLGLGERTVDD